ncbi:hypothetical protein ACLKA7_001037 [Drosophila subpalustris]
MAPITKRMRENSNAEIKASKGMDMSSILQLINERFKEQAELIASKMSQSEERILSLLHERLDSMSKEMQELCERVQQLERDASVVEALKTQGKTSQSKPGQYTFGVHEEAPGYGPQLHKSGPGGCVSSLGRLGRPAKFRGPKSCQTVATLLADSC